jgi:hypothetical protein
MTPHRAHSPTATQLLCPAILEACRPGEGISSFIRVLGARLHFLQPGACGDRPAGRMPRARLGL